MQSGEQPCIAAQAVDALLSSYMQSLPAWPDAAEPRTSQPQDEQHSTQVLYNAPSPSTISADLDPLTDLFDCGSVNDQNPELSPGLVEAIAQHDWQHPPGTSPTAADCILSTPPAGDPSHGTQVHRPSFLLPSLTDQGADPQHRLLTPDTTTPAAGRHPPPPAKQPSPSHPAPSTSTLHSYPLPTTPLPPSIDTLLTTPALLTTQLPKPRPSSNRATHLHRHAPLPPPAAPAIAKPKPRRKKKHRPSDTIHTLQQHLGTITAQLSHLSLRNHQLQRKKQVLDRFVQGLTRYESIATQIDVDIARSKEDPSSAPQGAAAFRDWTPEQFAEVYRAHVAKLAQWIAQVEAAAGAGGTPTPAAMAELEAGHQWFSQATLYAIHGRVDFVPRVMAEQLQLYSGTIPEEELWVEVLAAMELTEGQVEDLLVARDVFLRCSGNNFREHLHSKPAAQQQAAAAVGALAAVHREEHATRLATMLRKDQCLGTLMTFIWFHDILSPLQVARALVRAYPLLPNPIVMMNALHALHGQAPAGKSPLLNLEATPMATAGTLASLLQLAGAGPPGATMPLPGAHSPLAGSHAGNEPSVGPSSSARASSTAQYARKGMQA